MTPKDAKRRGGELRHPPGERLALARWRLSRPTNGREFARRIEWGIYAVACLLPLCHQRRVYRDSGAFWRDEISSIQLASAPSWDAMWTRLRNDSTPALFPVALRLWMTAGLGETDEGLRLFGTVLSLGLYRLVGRQLPNVHGPPPPLIATSLIAFNVSIFYYGSSLRAYGLAMLLILPCCAAFWRVVRQPSRWNISAAAALAILSCQASYQNSYLLLAIGFAGTGTCRQAVGLWKRGALVLAICGLAAASLLPCLPVLLGSWEHNLILRTSPDWAVIRENFIKAISLGSLPLLLVWTGLMLSAAAFLAVAVIGRAERSPRPRRFRSLRRFARLWRSAGASYSL